MRERLLLADRAIRCHFPYAVINRGGIVATATGNVNWPPSRLYARSSLLPVSHDYSRDANATVAVASERRREAAPLAREDRGGNPKPRRNPFTERLELFTGFVYPRTDESSEHVDSASTVSIVEQDTSRVAQLLWKRVHWKIYRARRE